MTPLANPYSFEPCSTEHFVGRADTLDRWRDRLTPGYEAWKTGKSWMLIGPGGIGKTSLMRRLEAVAHDEYGAWTLFLDLGHFRDLDSPLDLFHYLGTHVPPARRLGTRTRKWFGLQPDAPMGALTGQVTLTLLSKLALAYAPSAWGGLGPQLAGPGPTTLRQPEGIAGHLGQLLNNLDVLSEEQSGPVVVFVDQVGKIHDSYRWRFIGGLLLAMVAQTRQEGAGNLAFVLGFRPERKGLLEYHLPRGLFSGFIYHMEDVYSLAREEAVQAIIVRAGPYLTLPIANGIIDAVAGEAGVDPYAAQLGAMAIWDHLYGGESIRSPTELSQAAIAQIVGDGYGVIVNPFRARYTHWELLKLLAFNPGGLRLREIANRLHAAPSGSIPPGEVEATVRDLAQPTGYRLISVIGDGPEPRYTLSHDLLGEYIVAQISDAERKVEQARKILADGVWRYQALGDPLSRAELKFIWEYRRNLAFDDRSWKAIAASGLIVTDPCLLDWLREYPDQIGHELQALEVICVDPTVSVRLHLAQVLRRPNCAEMVLILGELGPKLETPNPEVFLGLLGQLGTPALPVLASWARTTEDPRLQMRAAETLGHLGQVELAATILVGLARTAKEWTMRSQATEALGQLGVPALPALMELAHTTEDQEVQMRAAEALGQLGQGELAVTILGALARTARAESMRFEAAKILGEFDEVEFAVTILTELTRTTKADSMRLEAAKILGELGQVELAVTILGELVRTAKAESERLEAAQALGKLDQVELAVTVLVELARTTKDQMTRQRATEALAEFGQVMLAVEALTERARTAREQRRQQEAVEALSKLGVSALPALTELARAAKAESVRLEAAKTLGKSGQVELAMSVLAELARKAKDRMIRLQAAVAVGQLGQVELAATSLVELARTARGRTMRQELAEALGKLGQVELAVTILGELARSAKNWLEQQEATEALGQLGVPALPMLVELACMAKAEWVRHEAAEALGKLGMPALPALMKLTHTTEDPKVKVRAAGALGHLGHVELAVTTLAELARTAEEEWVRQEAVEALGKFGVPALSALVEVAWPAPFEEPGVTAILEAVRVFMQSPLDFEAFSAAPSRWVTGTSGIVL